MVHVVKHFGSSIAAVGIALVAGSALNWLQVTGPMWILILLAAVIGFGAIIVAGTIENIFKLIFGLEWVGTIIYYGGFFWLATAVLLAFANWLPLGISVSSPTRGGFIVMVISQVFLAVLYKGSGWKRAAAFPKRRSPSTRRTQ